MAGVVQAVEDNLLRREKMVSIGTQTVNRILYTEIVANLNKWVDRVRPNRFEIFLNVEMQLVAATLERIAFQKLCASAITIGHTLIDQHPIAVYQFV